MGTASSAEVAEKPPPNVNKEQNEPIEVSAVHDKDTGQLMKHAGPSVRTKVKKKKWRKKRHNLNESEMKMVEMFLGNVYSKEDNGRLQEALVAVSAKTYIVREPKNTLLIAKGAAGEGVLFVLEGEVAMVAEDYSILAQLGPKQYFGEVETLFDVPTICSVVCSSSVKLLFVPKEQLRPLVSELNISISDWWIQHRHLVTTNDINFEHWRKQLMLSCFSQVAYFHRWPETSLESLIELLPPFPIILFPKGAIIIQEGDPGHKIHILVKGRLNLFGNQNYLCTIQANRFPFLLSEEAAMCGDRQRMTVVAEDPSLVAGIKTDWLKQASKMNETAQKAWSDNLQLWTRQRKVTQVKDLYRTFLQVELIYKCLRERVEFMLCPPKCVYMIARTGTASMWTSDEQQQLQSYDGEFLVILLTLTVTSEEGTQKDLCSIDNVALYSHKNQPPALDTDAEKTSLAIRYKMEEIAKVLQEFPGATLEL